MKDTTALTLAQARERYLHSLDAGPSSESTISLAGVAIRLLVDYAHAHGWPDDPQAIEVHHLEEYMAYLRRRKARNGGRLSETTRNGYYGILALFWDYLVSRAMAPANPVREIPAPVIGERVVPTLSDAECARLLSCCNRLWPEEPFYRSRNRAMVLLLLDTPIRRGELAGLNLGDVTLDATAPRLSVIGKGNKARYMPLGGATRHALTTYLEAREERAYQRGPDASALWIRLDGRRLTPNAIRLMMTDLGATAGLTGLHPHMFRHTFAVRWIRARGSEELLKRIGGWEQIPDTYLRTLAYEDAARMHSELAPGDRIQAAARHLSLFPTAMRA